MRAMKRREVLTAGGTAVLVSVSGCGTFLGRSTAPSKPDRPTPLSEANVVGYVTQHATADLHQRYSGGNIDCDGGLHLVKEGGYYVLVFCDVTKESDGAVIDAYHSGGYFVDSETTRGIWLAEEDYREAPESIYGGKSGDLSGIWLYNFATNPAQVTVHLTYLDTDSPETAFEQEYRMPAKSTVRQLGATGMSGMYRATVEYNGETVTHRFSNTESEDETLYTYVSPGGTLSVRSGAGKPWDYNKMNEDTPKD